MRRNHGTASATEVAPGGDGRLVVVSNRLPVVVARDGDGWRFEPGSGGLVTALEPVLESRGGLWIGWPGISPEALEEVRPHLADFAADHRFHLEPVPLTEREHELYYAGFANEVLWPLFHDLQTRCTFVPDYWEAFRAVNRRFGEVVAAARRPGDLIWVHDYQLIGVGETVRALAPEARLGFFLHIPFPPPDIFAKLPWRREILRGLLAYDLVGFQTGRDRRNFAACLRAFLPEAPVRGRGRGQHVLHAGRRVRIAYFPIGIDAESFASLARTEAVAVRAAQLRADLGVEHVALGVDRLDYTKGVPFKLEAVRRLLSERPEYRHRFTLVQLTVPSREEVPGYQQQKEEVERQVGEINGAFAEPGWVPIQYLFRSVPREELVALYRAADVCLATSLKDGMNLVAKEYCACQVDRRGVLVLSEFAGAAGQLERGALLINPYDIVGLAGRIHDACRMPAEERQMRMARLQRNVASEHVYRWVDEFLAALPAPAPEGSGSAAE